MILIKTTDAIRALQKLGGGLSMQELRIAQARAINRTLEKGRTSARKEVKRVYNISQRYLAGINYNKAKADHPVGELVASRKPIPLDAFAPKQETAGGSIRISRRGEKKARKFKRLKSNPTSGVSIEIKRGDPQVIPYAFLIQNGASRVFARGKYDGGTQKGFIRRFSRVNKTGNDTPVKPLITVSEFGSILNPDVMAAIGKQVKQVYPDRMEHEIQYMIDKAARAASNP